MADCVNALKEWTGKARATTIFDSTVDEFTADGLFAKVKGKPNVAIVGFTTDGDVFGKFYTVAVTEQDKYFNDPNNFVFSFESHGRCMTPQRFAVKEKRKAYVNFWKNKHKGFASFGVYPACIFWLGNERSGSYVHNLSCGFEGIKDTTLTGKNGNWREGPCYHCTQLVAIQLE